jgi:hypothetical protein
VELTIKVHRTYDQLIQLLKPDVKITLYMRVNARKENPTMADLDITSVSAPLAVLGSSSFTINVNVTASADSFEDGSGYRLFVLVDGLNLHQLIPFKGHLQDAPWTSPSAVFPVTVTAGASPDIYTITAALIEGPSGLDPDSVPTFGSAGPIIVV